MIPPTAHFLWEGTDFPFIYGLALRSAARWGGLRRVLLHHLGPIRETTGARFALATGGVDLVPLDPFHLLEEAVQDAGPWVDLYRRLPSPAARTNMLRAALLLRDGGVYLDTDVIVVTSLAPLLGAGVFCGAERVVYPASVVRSRSPFARLGALARSTLRDGLRRLPRGYLVFERVAWLYPTAVNNAVLGADAAHGFMQGLLDAMIRLEPDRQLRRFALGTHLLQEQVAKYGRDDLIVHPPEVFFPLAPELSTHWFRTQRHVRLSDVLRPSTRAVHWYASVRTKRVVAEMSPDYIRRNERHQLFCQLVSPLLD